MSLREGWQRWVHNPQGASWRKVLVKLHLWAGMTLGAYLILMSVTGSVAVFRRDLALALVQVNKSGGLPLPVVLMQWVVDLHDNLLAGDAGTAVNGVGSIAFGLLVLSGAVLWWPGLSRWWRSLIVPWPTHTRRFSWHLHSALGFWGFILLAGWAVTGIYFAFPDPFNDLFDALNTDPKSFTRPGENILNWFIRLHFGRYGTWGLDVVWALIGLLPVVLFVTGFIVWWKQRRQRQRAVARLGAPAPVGSATAVPPAE
jgi:uncharacterized iron-regulated membrane protein